MNDALRHELTFLRDLGFTHLDVAPITAGAPAVEDSNCKTLLAELQAIATVCEKCKLSKTRTQVVYGVGNPNADLMFIGEAPGRHEDEKGEPFVGRAGQLLTDIIKAMKLTRDDVYIANVVKCRPPENRNPDPEELDACRPYIRRQVEIIQPKVIVTLGKFALQSLTEKSYGITAARGQWLEYNGVKVMPTYHPAYLLRTPSAKKDVWNDMKLVMAELGMA
ncbi:MAG TPA: uracil-DNA glycosylase [Thermoanaerobaculia bacterium]|jgi:DNA polymerase|nr:uracil-DNA glycosylase [Thermoanaerobaculia bacterium]